MNTKCPERASEETEFFLQGNTHNVGTMWLKWIMQCYSGRQTVAIPAWDPKASQSHVSGRKCLASGKFSNRVSEAEKSLHPPPTPPFTHLL